MDACRLGILYGFNNATEGVSIYFLDENVDIPGKRIYQDKDDNIKVYDTIPAKSIQSSSFRNLDEDIFPKLDNRCISYEIKKTFIAFPQNLCWDENSIDLEIKKQGFLDYFSEENGYTSNDKFDSMSYKDYKTLIRFLSERNGRLVHCNPVITSMTGSNTAIYVLGSEEVDKAILFYLVKYIVKKAFEMFLTLAIVAAVREKNKLYQSIAADAGTTERNAKLFLQRTVNLIVGREEIPATQAACYLLNFPFNQCSESTLFVFIWSYIRHYRFNRNTISSNDDIDKDCDDNFISDENETDSPFEDNLQELLSQPHINTSKEQNQNNEDDDDSDEENDLDVLDSPGFDENDKSVSSTSYQFGNCKMYKGFDSNANSIKIPVSAEDLYLNRGSELQDCIPYTYHSIIDVIPIKSKSSDFDSDSEQNSDDDNDEYTNDDESIDDYDHHRKEEDIDNIESIESPIRTKKKSKKSGRKESKFYRFRETFVLYKTHKQVIRTKFHIPILAHPPCPKLPKFKKDSENKPKNIKKLDKSRNDVAEYLLALFSPSDPIDNLPIDGHTWKDLVKFCKKLLKPINDSTYPSFLGYCMFECMKNIFKGLKTNSAILLKNNKYRHRQTTLWADQEKFTRNEENKKVYADGSFDIYNDITPLFDKQGNQKSNESESGSAKGKSSSDGSEETRNFREIVDSLRKELDTFYMNDEDVISKIAEDRFLEASRDNIQACLGLNQTDIENITHITDQDGAIPRSSTKSTHDLYLTFKTEKDVTELITLISKHQPSYDGPSIQMPYKNYDHVGISTDSQMQFNLDCQNNMIKDKLQDFNSLFQGPLVTKANTHQKVILNEILNELDCLLNNDSKLSIQPKSFCLLGGPGAGKTYLIDCLIEQCIVRKVGLISSAFAASACLHIASCTSEGVRTPAYTLHTTLSISVSQMDSWKNRIQSLPEDLKHNILRNSFFKAYVFVLDETSMINATTVSFIADRLRQLSEKEYQDFTFGRYIYISVSDFRQLPPPKGSPMYYPVVDKYLFKTKYVVYFF
jgi:hypothetical protein